MKIRGRVEPRQVILTYAESDAWDEDPALRARIELQAKRAAATEGGGHAMVRSTYDARVVLRVRPATPAEYQAGVFGDYLAIPGVSAKPPSRDAIRSWQPKARVGTFR